MKIIGGGEGFEKPKSAIELVNKKNTINLINDFREKSKEKVKLVSEFDTLENSLYLRYYTQNFNKQNWSKNKKNIPAHKRHTLINHVYSEILALHPKEIEIKNMEQKAFMVPQYQWNNNLKPLEENKVAKMRLKGVTKIFNWAASSITPFSEKTIEDFIENSRKKQQKQFQEKAKEISKNYIATSIPAYPPNKGMNVTAREYKINFENNSKENQKVYIWSKIAVGDPSKADAGSFANKFGQLEMDLIEFEIKSLGEIKEVIPRVIDKKNMEIFAIYENGKKERLTYDPSIDYYAELSPDRKKIVFNSNRNNQFGVYPIHLKNKKIEKISEIGKDYFFNGGFHWEDNQNIFFNKVESHNKLVKGDWIRITNKEKTIINIINKKWGWESETYIGEKKVPPEYDIYRNH